MQSNTEFPSLRVQVDSVPVEQWRDMMLGKGTDRMD